MMPRILEVILVNMKPICIGLRSEISMVEHDGFLFMSCSLLTCFFILTGQKPKSLSKLLSLIYKGTNLIHEDSTLMTQLTSEAPVS